MTCRRCPGTSAGLDGAGAGPAARDVRRGDSVPKFLEPLDTGGPIAKIRTAADAALGTEYGTVAPDVDLPLRIVALNASIGPDSGPTAKPRSLPEGDGSGNERQVRQRRGRSERIKRIRDEPERRDRRLQGAFWKGNSR